MPDDIPGGDAAAPAIPIIAIVMVFGAPARHLNQGLVLLGAGLTLFLTLMNGFAIGSLGLILVGVGLAKILIWKLAETRALRRCADYIDDDGFSDRVMQSLPAPSRRPLGVAGGLTVWRYSSNRVRMAATPRGGQEPEMPFRPATVTPAKRQGRPAEPDPVNAGVGIGTRKCAWPAMALAFKACWRRYWP